MCVCGMCVCMHFKNKKGCTETFIKAYFVKETITADNSQFSFLPKNEMSA